MTNREVLVRFIAREFLRDKDLTEIPEDLDLVSTGIIDSLGVLKVVAFLEESFGLSIEAEAMLPANFSSIGAMLGVLSRQAAAPQSQ
jgi:acyl carrier protein